MDNNILYKITPKLDEIYQKLLKLDKYDFDYSKFKDQINEFDKKISSFDLESNNMVGSMAISKPDEKLINELYISINEFDKLIDKIIDSFKIFDSYEKYQSNIKNIKDEDSLNEIISQILNDLLGYIFVIKNGLKENNETNNINYMLYSAIKKEFKLKGNSIVFNTLIKNNLENIIVPFVNEDIEKYKNDEDIKSRSLDMVFGTASEKEVKDLLLLISISDDNYKDSIKHNFDTLNIEKGLKNRNIRYNTEKIDENNDEILREVTINKLSKETFFDFN